MCSCIDIRDEDSVSVYVKQEVPILKSKDDVTNLISIVKEEILSAPESRDKRKELVRQLIQLRLTALELEELEVDGKIIPETCFTKGHKFILCKNSFIDHQVCETCHSIIWGFVVPWYKCSDCSYASHKRCLNFIHRECVYSLPEESCCYTLDICPEEGLSSQQYRCEECHRKLYPYSLEVPKLCDYNGKYYCSGCHQDDMAIIPARVIHGWDFAPRKVCRKSKQLLNMMFSRPILKISEVNNMLFTFVDELNYIKKMRVEFLSIMKYVKLCRKVTPAEYYSDLNKRPHFFDNSDHYSLQDLIDCATGALWFELKPIQNKYLGHIRSCDLCYGRGYLCEVCGNNEVIFPFDDGTVPCEVCNSVSHVMCYSRTQGTCPKCNRRERTAQ